MPEPPLFLLLKQNEYSFFPEKGRSTKKLYGNRGDRVEVLSDHGNVLIVKGVSGAFSVRKTDTIEISDENKNSKN